MALYIPAGARRRRAVVLGVVALVVGLLLGGLIGRATAPSAADGIEAIRSDARQTVSGLRVLSLHDQAGTASVGSGDGGAALVLTETRRDLTDELDRAPWITADERRSLFRALAALDARSDASSSGFGAAAETLAAAIEDAFGLRGSG